MRAATHGNTSCQLAYLPDAILGVGNVPTACEITGQTVGTICRLHAMKLLMPRVPSKQRFDVSLEHLKTFLAVAGLGSFGRAATQLSLSQPSVSNRVRRLEEKLAVRLLNRTTRRVQLTADGHRLKAKASMPCRRSPACCRSSTWKPGQHGGRSACATRRRDRSRGAGIARRRRGIIGATRDDHVQIGGVFERLKERFGPHLRNDRLGVVDILPGQRRHRTARPDALGPSRSLMSALGTSA